ncbi:MAG: hypothetical protein FWB90_01525 [Fibromonadales bacterium]|nr:hypothetical protein [Fibromonadales bacterium]
MLELIRTIFRKFVSILLFVDIIGCTIGGAIIGSDFKHGILGFNIGLLIGVISALIFGGLLATILNMDKNLQEIRDHLTNKQCP